jgi:hypothetical protein
MRIRVGIASADVYLLSSSSPTTGLVISSSGYSA